MGSSDGVAYRRDICGRIALAFCVTLVALTLVGCSDRNEAFIQGSWFYSAPSVGGVAPESSVHTFWTFGDGSFSADSCCENRGTMSGSYRIISSEGDLMVLEIDDTEDEEGPQTYELEIRVDRERKSLFLQGTGPFLRVQP